MEYKTANVTLYCYRISRQRFIEIVKDILDVFPNEVAVSVSMI